MIGTIIVLAVLGVVVLLLLIGVGAAIVVRLLKGPLEARIADQYSDNAILLKDLTANCFGLESLGVWQARGNGALVLTDSQLHFFMFLPRREFQVPLNSITEITFTKRHLGKVTPHDLLKVEFALDGKSDSIAWYLADPRLWKERIQGLLPTRQA